MNFNKIKIKCSTGEVTVGYNQYLKSKHWNNLRREIIKERSSTCERCFDIVNSPHIHHKTYKRLGKENKTDLTLLCGKCHKIIHNKRKEGRTSSLKHVQKIMLSLEEDDLKVIYKQLHEMLYPERW